MVAEMKESIGKCARTDCQQKTDMTCGRCGDFYCSSECQKMDWQFHRYICFPMASLRIAGEERTNRQNTADNGSQASAVASNGAVKAAPVAQPVAVKEIKPVEAPAKNPVQATPPKIQKLPKPVATKPAEPAVKPVEVAAKPAEPAAASSKLLAGMIRRPQFKAPAPVAPPKKVMIFDLKVREFSDTKAKVIYLAMVDEKIGNMMIFCEDPHYEEFLDISTKIQDYCKDKKPGYDPELNEVVLCRFADDELWYRAVIGSAKNEEGKYAAFFIDYGNAVFSPPNEIIQLPQELKFDVISKTCCVKNAPKFSKDFTETQVEILCAPAINITDIKAATGDVDCIECNIVGF